MNNIFLTEKNENETEIKFEYEETSSKEVFIFMKEPTAYSDSMQESPSASSTLEYKKQSISPYENYLVQYKTKKEKEKLDRLIDSLTHELAVELKYFSMEDSDITSAERKIFIIAEQYSFRVLGEVLQNIYVRYNDYPNMLAGICKGLGRFDLDEVLPWGPTMLSGLLLHKNEMVKEYAVSLVENWSDTTLLPILRNLDCSSLWLQEYISDVVKYLEEYYVLHKKVI